MIRLQTARSRRSELNADPQTPAHGFSAPGSGGVTDEDLDESSGKERTA